MAQSKLSLFNTHIVVKCLLLFFYMHTCGCDTSEVLDNNVLVLNVATAETDGYRRYMYSAREFGITPKTLGMGLEWKGGDVKNYPGGGFKVNLLKEAAKEFKDDKNKIIIFSDAYDVVFASGLMEIVTRFKKTGAHILFSAETFCWPDPKLASEYPKVKQGKPYLNSGLFMGYAPDLYTLLRREQLEDDDDDQLFYTKAYLDKHFREQLNVKLDHMSEIFQNLNGAQNDIELVSDNGEFFVSNIVTQTRPLIIHGNGRSKIFLNTLSNYISHSWSTSKGCHACLDGHIDLEHEEAKNMPSVLIALFIEQPTPFLEEFFMKIKNLIYPKDKIHLFIHNNAKYHVNHVKEFVDQLGKQYASLKQISPEDNTNEWTARDLSLDRCDAKKCDFYFSVDSIAQLDNPFTLRLLAEQNRSVVAPLLPRPGKAWSNFWGALTADGYYARSNDYMDIAHSDKRGLWNVPFVSNCYLINATVLKQYDRKQIHYTRGNLDADMAFCANLRELEVFMFVSNRVDFGHLVNPETFDVTRAAPDMYQMFENAQDWESRYIHEEYPENFNPVRKADQPCPDVYWFPIVTRRFCNDLIYMMETFGQWSDGKNSDPRLDGGYEAVPTRDIHMNQVGWERHWLHFLDTFVRPLQEHVFVGYFHQPPKSLMNFVVRYRPDEQPSLRPHHDSSTYTINIALNEPGVDYEGGGCHFLRYNCSVTNSKPGWVLMHPGRLTHYHEGLPTIKGTRYIMISFVDP